MLLSGSGVEEMEMSCQLVWRDSSTGQMPQQGSSQCDRANRGQSLHGEGPVGEEVAEEALQVMFRSSRHTEPNVDLTVNRQPLSKGTYIQLYIKATMKNLR